MRAVGVVRYGGPEALEVVDLPEPHAGPGQVRIRVHAATVNPTDTYVRNGDRAELQQRDPGPYVPGMDAAGVLDEIGEGVNTDLAVGDCRHGAAGCYGGYVVQLAKADGLHVVADASPSDEEALTEIAAR
jgi:NADPH:quinone reductase-like Zn-dependent oxidoreductase